MEGLIKNNRLCMLLTSSKFGSGYLCAVSRKDSAVLTGIPLVTMLINDLVVNPKFDAFMLIE